MSDVFLHRVDANTDAYFIQAQFGKDVACKILVTNVKCCWEGQMDRKEIESSALETEMNYDDYYELMKKALTGCERCQEFEYGIKESEGNNLLLEWKRVQDDVKYCLGTISAKKSTDQVKAMQQMLTLCNASLLSLNTDKMESNKARLELEGKYLNAVKELEKCCELKEGLEVELMSKFVLVINEKKSKIRALKRQIDEDRAVIKQLEDKVKGGNTDIVPNEDKATCSKTIEIERTAVKQSDEDNSLEIVPILAKRRRTTKPLNLKVSPVKVTNKSPTADMVPDPDTTFSSDSTIDVNDLLENA
ncbi:unnamed protein product [Clavelina lepadiformis]|uniref:DNA repair protein XRCC4 n=1 Tax=Clavelina lepadiformis TaxID=159417 RepID=A0ABP0FN07_CLALP